MYFQQLLIIIYVDREPYIRCESFVILLTEMSRHLIRFFNIYAFVLHKSSANVFLELINELYPFKKNNDITFIKKKQYYILFQKKKKQQQQYYDGPIYNNTTNFK